MSNTEPLRLNGATFHADKTGLVTIVQPWEVHTLEELVTFTPANRPFGLPVTDRAATEWDVGTWTLQLTFEGKAEDGDVSFENAETVKIELDTSMSQDPIKSHPYFAGLKLKYGWNTDKEEFGETMPSSAADKGNALSNNPKPKRNLLHGTDSYLVVGAIFRLTYTTRRPPRDVLDGIGTVVERPPGWQLLNIANPKGRNWLKLGPKIELAGNATRIVNEHMLSGPNGWVRDVYTIQQLSS